jgi:hypothetical protein
MKRSEISKNHIYLTALISQLDGVEAAILKERIISSAKEVLENKETVKRALQGGFISADLYINTMEKVYNCLEK